ncbi:MAG: site-specific integrase [Bacteroidota bacterium]
MPYKRKESPYYQIRKHNLPGYGDTGVLSSKTTVKKVARSMEQTLDEIAAEALISEDYRLLLEAVCRDKTVDLPTLLAHRNRGELHILIGGFSDPRLSTVVDEFRNIWTSRQELTGLDQLLEVVPKGARLSYLYKASNITEICHALERSRSIKRNSVRRYMLRSISKILRHKMGNAERDRIFADVQYAAEDDTREVHLTPDQIKRLIRACNETGHDELALIVQVALVTSADRGVLLAGPADGKMSRGLLKRDLKLEKDGGVVYLQDSKTDSRSRSVPLSPTLAEALRTHVRHKLPDDPIFELQYGQLDYTWQQVREAAGLPNLRFKDLRAQVSQYGEEAGVPLTVLQQTMGHADATMTRRYQRRQSSLSFEQAAKIEAAMGLSDRQGENLH